MAVSLNKLGVGALLLATTIGPVSAHPVETDTPKPVAVSQTAQTDTPKTPSDYVNPLDNWLKAQGSPLNGKDFYEVGLQYHLDPDFLIAVTKAETNLGKVQQRGSSCNVGSVGSYDSTNTTHSCTSQRQGIEMIAQTLNNGLLGKYDKVSQLSRRWNKQGHVYASSEYNWDHNVISTMNALKGGHEMDYVFRKTYP